MLRKLIPTALCLFLLYGFPLSGQDDKKKPGLDTATLKGLTLRGIGPALMSGRIADIAIDPTDQSTWYVAVGSGGVWKTVNAGTTWTPVFEDQSSYSVGCVAVDPRNAAVIWAGTGENVSGRHVGYGDGIYKSTDAGKSWTNMGLKASEHISKILVDPRDSNTVYVAAEGPLWSAGGERGVFKTSDGGQAWSPALQISENTGVTDLEFDPRNPDVVYAAAYQRRRSIWALLAGGPESAIYKSTDAGNNWKKLTNGLPTADKGRIGLAVSPIDSRVVYATIESTPEARGFYRSADSGESWEKRSSYTSGGTGPHYYQEIYASPHQMDRIYQMDVWIHVSEDGGRNFRELGEPDKHSDNHALAFNPSDPDYLLAGTDGGLYETWDLGRSWKFVQNLPVTQIYKLAIDNDTPFYNVVGGTQDNGTILGPSRVTRSHGALSGDWIVAYGADGYACQIDPEDPNIVYVEWQNGHLLRYDKKTRQTVDVQPQPQPGDPPERFNWDAPILISPHSHTRLYFGSQRLWRSDDRGDSWTAISGDLSKDINRYELPMMGSVKSVNALYDNGAMSMYGNLTTISESPLQEGLIYVGSDDGLIQVTEDGGRDWRRVASLPGVPEGSFVNEIKASVTDAQTVFAVLDNHKTGDFQPYILKSSNRGRSWTSMRGDLPDRHILWSIVQDEVNKDLLFLGTEFGIFFTIDGGSHWVHLEGGVPHIPFRDLEIQRRDHDLVGASFGRGFYILDDYTPLRTISDPVLQQDVHLFPLRDALLYVPSVDLGVRNRGYQGGSFFTAENPPFGALFTFYLKESKKSSREQRVARETELREAGEDIPFPGWDKLEQESREGKPSLLLAISDGEGRVIRRLEAPSSAGFHRVAWDLRFPAFTPIEVDEPSSLSPFAEPDTGPLVTPGRYSVQLMRLENGEMQSLGSPQSFQVVALDNGALPAQDPAEVLAFERQVGELQRRVLAADAVVDDSLRRLEFIKKAIRETPAAAAPLLAQANSIESGLRDVRKELVRDRTRASLNEATTPSIEARVSDIIGGHWNSTYGPTKTHRQSYEIAARQFEQVNSRIKKLTQDDLARLEKSLEEAGAPWTPGRPIP